MKKILHIIPTLNFGGITSVVSNWHDVCHGKHYHFDYVAFNDGPLRTKFSSSGSKIYILATIRISPIKYITSLIRILRSECYDVIHVHNSFKNGLALLIARIIGIEVRVCHSHTSGLEDASLNAILPLLKWLAIANANVRVACGNQAGIFLYGDNSFTTIKNTIDVHRIIVESSNSKGVKDYFNLPLDKFLLGHVGRFSEVKNHRFLLDIAERLDPRYIFVLVGAGPIKDIFRAEVAERYLDERFVFLDPTKEIPKLLGIFDAFLMPSFFEGVSLALLEAQAASLPCIASELIPRENDVGLGLVNFLSLEDPDMWTSKILAINSSKQPAEKISEAFTRSGFTNDSLLKSIKTIYK